MSVLATEAIHVSSPSATQPEQGSLSHQGKSALLDLPDLISLHDSSGGAAHGPKSLLADCHAANLAEARTIAVPITCGWAYVAEKLGGCRQMSFDDVVEGLKRIAHLGFHYVELEAYGRTGANAIYQHREDLREWLDQLGLRASVFSYADYTLMHTDFRNEARFALERFQEKALPTASALGAEMIVINSFTPSGVFYTDPERDPTDPTYYRWPPYSEEDLRTSRLKLSDDFSMKAAWEALVAGCKIAAELSRRQGFPLVLRARGRELCETCADLINLCNDVNFSNFFVAMDTALCNCGEECLYAVKKLVELPRRSGRVLSIYAADNDGHAFQRRAPRDGVGQRGIDWDQLAKILRQSLYYDGKPFRGPFILEVGGIDPEDIDRCLVTAAHRVQNLLTGHRIPWLI